MYYLLIILVCTFFFSFIAFRYKRKEKQNLAYERSQLEQNYQQKLKELENRNIELKAANKEIVDRYESVANGFIEKAKQNAAAYEQLQQSLINNSLKEYEQQKKEQLDSDFNSFQESFDNQKAAAQVCLDTLNSSIEEAQKKQAAINEEILRRKEIENQKDFYRICLQPEYLNDVTILREARKNLKKPEIIDKIIYDNYIAKPVLEMIKRVLQNTTCCGIYKITCLTTGEIYIGKSTDIKNRWQQHCKSAFNCGTIASSLLHTKMKEYGIENFSFEVLEKVPKEKLSEREKFYINFYGTKETGFNERNG